MIAIHANIPARILLDQPVHFYSHLLHSGSHGADPLLHVHQLSTLAKIDICQHLCNIYPVLEFYKLPVAGFL